MSEILEQLELNQTFFTQFGLIFVLFLFLSNVYFKPFLKLFAARHGRTVKDREAAEQLIAQADAKFEEYKTRIAAERAAARKEHETMLSEAKAAEAQLLNSAREQAKKITQETLDSLSQQRAELVRKLEVDVEGIANHVADSLLRKE